MEDGRVLLMRRRKPDGETPEEAAIREAKEETGLDDALARKLGPFYHEGRTIHYFVVASHRWKLRLGSPERERRNEENVYELEWVGAKGLEEIPLRPPHAKRICRDLMKKP